VRFDLITIFPEFFTGPLDFGIVSRAREAGIAEVRVHDLRNWTSDRHRTVDDRPFGGGEGMVLKPEPIFAAVEELLGTGPESGKTKMETGESRGGTAIVLLSASGRLFRQTDARRLAVCQRVVLICGRYEGVDERVAGHLATDEFSIGDFVLSGGELPAAMIVDGVTRLLPGALGNEDSTVNESFGPPTLSSQLHPANVRQPVAAGFELNTPLRSLLARAAAREDDSHGVLDCPHYTRPPEFRGWAVPEVLLSGNHEQIRQWRRKMALTKTIQNRPDLLPGAVLDDTDRGILDELASRGGL